MPGQPLHHLFFWNGGILENLASNSTKYEVFNLFIGIQFFILLYLCFTLFASSVFQSISRPEHYMHNVMNVLKNGSLKNVLNTFASSVRIGYHVVVVSSHKCHHRSHHHSWLLAISISVEHCCPFHMFSDWLKGLFKLALYRCKLSTYHETIL